MKLKLFLVIAGLSFSLNDYNDDKDFITINLLKIRYSIECYHEQPIFNYNIMAFNSFTKERYQKSAIADSVAKGFLHFYHTKSPLPFEVFLVTNCSSIEFPRLSSPVTLELCTEVSCVRVLYYKLFNEIEPAFSVFGGNHEKINTPSIYENDD